MIHQNEYKTLNADQLFYVIIYKPELVETFISLCKLQKRLFYLLDLKEFYIKTGREEECRKLFLRNGLLLFEYKGLENLYKIEHLEIEF